MRLQLMFLAVATLLGRSSAHVILNETVSQVYNDSTSRVDGYPTDFKVKFPTPAFRPRPMNMNSMNTMRPPQINALGPRSLIKRLSLVPLRGFFAFKSPQIGSDALQQDELVNCSGDTTNCLQQRQMSKRMAMASGVPRPRRPYDVPQIECPPARDGAERFSCPSPDRTNRYRCIEDRALCDGFIDCPNAEDEDMRACMFYKTTKAHLDVLADALLRWARGRY